MFRWTTWRSLPFRRQLLIFMIGLLWVSAMTVGLSGYQISRRALDDRGKTILKNGVEMAMMLISSKQDAVVHGTLTLSEAQEQVKQALTGPRQANGHRRLNTPIDIGTNGYFIVYSKDGYEIMHPTLEGEYVWNVQSKDANPFFIVQEQIQLGLQGGGFSVYSWNYPSSEKIGRKIAYSKLDPNWSWVVVASAYETDYNNEANAIMAVMVGAFLVLLLAGIMVSSLFIRKMTEPIVSVSRGMKQASEGVFATIPDMPVFNETYQLVTGYNNMVLSIGQARRDLLEQEEKIREMACFDILTGLPNHLGFSEHVGNRIHNLASESGLILVEINDYKLINALYGNVFGDQLMISIARGFPNPENVNDMLCRFRGNEFAYWLEDCDTETVARFASRLKRQLTSHIRQFFDHPVDIHVGFACYPEDGSSFDLCYQHAAVALQQSFQAENSGPNRFSNDMAVRIEEETHMRQLLMNAFEHDEFSLHYQTKVNGRSGKVMGVEALARWYSPVLGPVSPGVFIPVLHKNNKMSEFSRYVFRKALDEYPSLCLKYDPEITISVNIPPVFFFKDSFEDFILTEIRRRGISAEKVILEITEDTFVGDFELLRTKVDNLRQQGVKISLDDFGTGYSSLNYLTSVRFDELKIDRAFIRQLNESPEALPLFRSILDVARIFHYNVVAEGVETREQLDILLDAGCCVIQGFYFSRPEPL